MMPKYIWKYRISPEGLTKTTSLPVLHVYLTLVLLCLLLFAGTTVAATIELIQSGDFEIDDPVWLAFAAEHTSERAHSGTSSAKLVPAPVPDNNPNTAMLGQTITIPTDTSLATLRFSWKNEGPDVGYYLSVLITSPYPFISDTKYTSDLFRASDTAWQTDQIVFSEGDLGLLRGQTVTIWLIVTADDSSNTVYIDDVSFVITQHIPTPPTATLTGTATPTSIAIPTVTATNTPIGMLTPQATDMVTVTQHVPTPSTATPTVAVTNTPIGPMPGTLTPTRTKESGRIMDRRVFLPSILGTQRMSGRNHSTFSFNE